MDQTPPVTTVMVPPADTYGWYNQPIVAHVSGTGNLSGVGWTKYSLNGTLTTVLNQGTGIGQTFDVPVSMSGVNILQYASVDRAGNQETVHSLTLKIDALPPEAAIHFVASPVTNPNVAVIGTDALSGVAGETGPVCGPVPATTTKGGGSATRRPAEQCTWLITNRALNTLRVVMDVKETAHQLQARVVSL